MTYLKFTGFLLPVFSVLLSTAQSSQDIKLNQVGFFPKSIKKAFITGQVTKSEFYITTTNHKDTVYKGIIGNSKQSSFSSTITRSVDFSRFEKPGRYVIVIPSVGYSYPFQIDNTVLKDLSKAVIKGFFYQRMSTDLDKKYAGKWERKGGHPDTAVLIHPSAASAKRPAGFIISTPGGWYDAGDYNKYIVNSGITMGTLFSAYEDFPEYYNSLNINIPESGNRVPDLLNETLYNLRWMLSMQDPNDGGVYHKCTNATFDPMIMPSEAVKTRYVVKKSTPAALDFAAVMAQAARVLKHFSKQLPHLSDSCMAAAFHAWQWALINNSVDYNQRDLNKLYQPAITTGEYGDKHFNDEWMWAASELFITTKNRLYLHIIKERIKDSVSLPSWSNVSLLAYYSLVRHKKELKEENQLIGSMQQAVIRMADHFISGIPANAFDVVMGQSKSDFTWGSNSVAANQGIVLINAFLLTKNKNYLDAAMGNLDYILGRNATGYCFVTVTGSKSPMHPHHRLSIADGVEDPIPGLLVGGPNPGQQDKCPYPYHEPETSYVDSDCAYASNEIAINWNAPLVYLTGALEFLNERIVKQP